MMGYLDGINLETLKKLNGEQLTELAREIREFLIGSVSKTGGHLASNLGVVELTIALHRVFDCPADRIVWDVGHQAYVHKILTGRGGEFSRLRQYGGLSGFPRPCREPSATASGPGTAVPPSRQRWGWPAPGICRERIIRLSL